MYYARMAGTLFPLDWHMRGASARLISSVAIMTENEAWGQAAIAELKHALETDYTAGDMLIRLIALDLATGNNTEAQLYYNQFKRVAKASPLIQLVAQAHQEASSPVAGKP